MPDPTPAQPPRGALTYKWAALADRFKLTPAEIAGLTDFQIDRLFFHARDKDGVLRAPEAAEPPPPPPTDEGRRRTLDALEHMRVITPDEAARLRAELDARETPEAH